MKQQHLTYCLALEERFLKFIQIFRAWVMPVCLGSASELSEEPPYAQDKELDNPCSFSHPSKQKYMHIQMNAHHWQSEVSRPFHFSLAVFLVLHALWLPVSVSSHHLYISSHAYITLIGAYLLFDFEPVFSLPRFWELTSKRSRHNI